MTFKYWDTNYITLSYQKLVFLLFFLVLLFFNFLHVKLALSTLKIFPECFRMFQNDLDETAIICLKLLF